MKTGLVLEGGAMRGLFSAGVMDVMMEHNIELDGLIGVSAGAAFGCNYLTKQIGRSLRYNLKYCNDKRYCSFHSLIKTGDLYGADFCYHELPERLDIFDKEAFRNSPMEFYIVCTDVETGRPVYHKCGNDSSAELEWIRASASMPLVSRIVEIDGKHLLDGGISDSIPLQYFQSIGFNKNIVILTQPRDYIKKKNKLMPILRRALKQYPKACDAMAMRHDVYNETLRYIAEEETAGNTLVICPDEALPISRIEHDPAKLQAVYDIGRSVAQKRLTDIIDFLNKVYF